MARQLRELLDVKVLVRHQLFKLGVVNRRKVQVGGVRLVIHGQIDAV